MAHGLQTTLYLEAYLPEGSVGLLHLAIPMSISYLILFFSPNGNKHRWDPKSKPIRSKNGADRPHIESGPGPASRI